MKYTKQIENKISQAISGIRITRANFEKASQQYAENPTPANFMEMARLAYDLTGAQENFEYWTAELAEVEG